MVEHAALCCVLVWRHLLMGTQALSSDEDEEDTAADESPSSRTPSREQRRQTPSYLARKAGVQVK